MLFPMIFLLNHKHIPSSHVHLFLNPVIPYSNPRLTISCRPTCNAPHRFLQRRRRAPYTAAHHTRELYSRATNRFTEIFCTERTVCFTFILPDTAFRSSLKTSVDETTANKNRTLPERFHDVQIHHRRARSSLPSKAPISKRRNTFGSSHKGTMGLRASGFSQSETEILLELLEEYLPLGKEEWETVSRLQEARYLAQRGNTDSLRRKFSALCRTTVPTLDPSIPPEVRQAKRVRKQMAERADIGDGVESGDEHTEDLNEETAALSSSVFETNGTDGATVLPVQGSEVQLD